MHITRVPALLTFVVAAAALSAAAGPVQIPKDKSLAPFVATPEVVVDRMLALAGVTKDDLLYDLGCGDGRIPITAAKRYGARAVGVDIDPARIRESRANARKAGVEHLVTFVLQDATTVDVSPATVVTLYLLSSSNMKLRPMLTRQLRPGARIVSHSFNMDDWKPEKMEFVDEPNGVKHLLYLWTADGVAR